jgi:hypothetical protein
MGFMIMKKHTLKVFQESQSLRIIYIKVWMVKQKILSILEIWWCVMPRLIHGSYANHSVYERTLITFWYHPDYSKLPVPMKVRIHEIFMLKGVDIDPDGEKLVYLLD